MKGQVLLSEEWCDIVFEGRNKEYGAYQLRKETGARYRRVAVLLGTVFGAFVLLAGIAGIFIYKAVVDRISEIEEEVKQLKPLEKDSLKAVSAGRRAIKGSKEKTTEQAPEMVEEAEAPALPIGFYISDDPEALDDTFLDMDKDLAHNTDQKDLPVEGIQLVETEKVEEMPKFPGGIDALMKFMDENVIYTGAAQGRRLEGEVLVAFIINPEGFLVEAEIVKRVDPLLDNAVLNAVRKMPKWQPGKVNGKPAAVKVCIPVNFVLQ